MTPQTLIENAVTTATLCCTNRVIDLYDMGECRARRRFCGIIASMTTMEVDGTPVIKYNDVVKWFGYTVDGSDFLEFFNDCCGTAKPWEDVTCV